MKRILILSLIANSMGATLIDDLESAIMKSDLQAVEQIVSEGVSITEVEQVGLINLASDVIRKREEKITVNEFRLTVNRFTAVKYREGDERPISYYLKGGAFFLFSLSAFSIGISDSAVGYAKFAVYAAATIGLICGIVNTIKGDNLWDKLIEKNRAHYKMRYNAALQIRQCLYRMKIR